MVYKYFDHIADTGIIGIGPTYEKSFEEAAKAMFNLMVDIKEIKKDSEIKIDVRAGNNSELFVEFLNELLSLSDLKEIMFCDFKIEIINGVLRGVAIGEKITSNMQFKTEVKAATYSQLEVREEKGKIISKTVVDL